MKWIACALCGLLAISLYFNLSPSRPKEVPLKPAPPPRLATPRVIETAPPPVPEAVTVPASPSQRGSSILPAGLDDIMRNVPRSPENGYLDRLALRTAAHLELPESLQAPFAESYRHLAADMNRLFDEFKAAVERLPTDDKGALDGYVALSNRIGAAVDLAVQQRLGSYLDPEGKPSHRAFVAQQRTFLKYLTDNKGFLRFAWTHAPDLSLPPSK